MADKKLNEVPVVSDIVTIFGKRSNGEIVQIDNSNLATLLGGLLQNGNYIRMAEGKGSAALHRIDFTRDLNLVIKIVGEGNSKIVDDYSIVCGHGGGNHLCITHNSGPSSIRMYRDNDYYFCAPHYKEIHRYSRQGL